MTLARPHGSTTQSPYVAQQVYVPLQYLDNYMKNGFPGPVPVYTSVYILPSFQTKVAGNLPQNPPREIQMRFPYGAELKVTQVSLSIAKSQSNDDEADLMKESLPRKLPLEKQMMTYKDELQKKQEPISISKPSPDIEDSAISWCKMSSKCTRQMKDLESLQFPAELWPKTLHHGYCCTKAAQSSTEKTPDSRNGNVDLPDLKSLKAALKFLHYKLENAAPAEPVEEERDAFTDLDVGLETWIDRCFQSLQHIRTPFSTIQDVLNTQSLCDDLYEDHLLNQSKSS